MSLGQSRQHMYLPRESEDDYVLNFDWESIEEAKKCILWRGDWLTDTRTTVDLLEEQCVLPALGTVCDFGVGIGRITQEILSRKKETKVVGVDRSLVMLRHAENYINDEVLPRYRGLSSTALLRGQDEFVGAFDAIIMIEVLQHIPEIEIDHSLPILMRTLNSKGVLFVLGNELLDAPSRRFGIRRRRVSDALKRYSRVLQSGVSNDFSTPRFWFKCRSSC